MKYCSTRGNSELVSGAYAIKKGIAPDGGLYMPTEIPTLTAEDITALCEMDYAHRAADILYRFLDDYNKDELLEDCIAAYSEANFPGGAAPLHKLDEGGYVLELFHGPTCAFKDMALQIMPRLLSRALKMTGEDKTALILVATSGDTGKAALEGYRDVPGIAIKVFYPVHGVSKVQKLQMATQEGANVSVCAIEGNFDDAQNGVKKIFSDAEINKQLNDGGYILTSANSINWGRLAPQVVYYISAYCDLLKAGDIKAGQAINFTVPTGNFGNIFAAYIAKQMGLPINKLICASNRNNILTDFLQTGVYDRRRKFYQTMSPSMDILISSNLERLLYLICGAEKTAEYMNRLNTIGKYKIELDELNKIKATFMGMHANEAHTLDEIGFVYEHAQYLSDTHTGVALYCASKFRYYSDDVMVTVSTASPYKFAKDVLTAVGGECDGDEFAPLYKLNEITGVEIPAPLASLKEKTVRFTDVIDPDKMAEETLKILA